MTTTEPATFTFCIQPPSTSGGDNITYVVTAADYDAAMNLLKLALLDHLAEEDREGLDVDNVLEEEFFLEWAFHGAPEPVKNPRYPNDPDQRIYIPARA